MNGRLSGFVGRRRDLIDTYRRPKRPRTCWVLKARNGTKCLSDRKQLIKDYGLVMFNDGPVIAAHAQQRSVVY
jgi:hypothetical protein